MKRLLFASMIFLLTPAFAQTKAGKTDTVKHAVFYSCAASPGCCQQNISLSYSAKEQGAIQKTGTAVQKVCIPLKGKRRQQLFAKETLKKSITD